MLQPNNKEIDVEQLSKKIETLKARTVVLSDVSLPDVPAEESLDLLIADDHLAAVASANASTPVVNPVTFTGRMKMLFSPGIGLRQRLGLIPIFGACIIWLNSILRLNSVRHKIALDFDAVRTQSQQLQDQITQQQMYFDAQIKQLEHAQSHLNELQNEFRHKLQKDLQNELQVKIPARFVQLENLSLTTHINRIDALVISNVERDNRLASLVREVSELHSRTTRGNVVNTKLSNSAITAPNTKSDEAEVPWLDNFYVEFEDNFRGTPEDIASRLSVYIPYLSQFSGDQSATVVDIGCGRGEWLGLLQKNEIKAIGIDMNASMVDACVEQGFSAECLDAIDYLRQQPEASLAAITGFHIIEHLPFKVLLSLFDVALRALRPDGLIIFETPNPENLSVGACNFYFDPTHLNPIVPAVAQFMAKQRGFAKADILRLHPYPEDFMLVEDSEVAVRVNRALYGPQDFAVVAWKTNAN
nr:class I SAM-dependent methyltransferase [uncultured Undibacterium sp.]